MDRPKKFEVASDRLADCNRLLKTIQRSIFDHIKDSAKINVTKEGTVDATVNLQDIEQYVAEDDEVINQTAQLISLLIIRKQDEIEEFLEELEDQERQRLKEEYEEQRYIDSHQPTGLH